MPLTTDQAKCSFPKTLYLYASGGSGHRLVKDALLERDLLAAMRKLDPPRYQDYLHSSYEERGEVLAQFVAVCKEQGLIHEVDVLREYGGRLGRWGARSWNAAKARADVEYQEYMVAHQRFFDTFYGTAMFFRAFRDLIRHKPQRIVSSQHVGLAVILLAIKWYNLFFRPKGQEKVYLDLYPSDMATAYCIHFLSPIKRLTNLGGKKYLRVHVLRGLKETDWDELMALPRRQIRELSLEELPVRLPFLMAAAGLQERVKDSSLRLKVSCQAELALLRATLKSQGQEVSNLGDFSKAGAQKLEYPIHPDDEGFFLMLGSHPPYETIKEYIAQFIEVANSYPGNKYHLFLFAQDYNGEGETSLYKDLSYDILKQPSWPRNLRVVPLSFQDPAQVAGLELRCHTITYSGGATVMELLVLDQIRQQLHLPRKERFVHVKPMEGRTLFEAIPLWEKGNYLVLQERLKAQLADDRGFLDGDSAYAGERIGQLVASGRLATAVT